METRSGFSWLSHSESAVAGRRVRSVRGGRHLSYEKARERFKSSLNPQEPADVPILWNDYVHATLAFLDNNMEELRLRREKIANGRLFNGRKANLWMVDGMIKCFDKPYVVATSLGCAD